MNSQLWLLLPLFSMVLTDSPVVVLTSTPGKPLEFTLPTYMDPLKLQPTYYLALENNFATSSCKVVDLRSGMGCKCSIEYVGKGALAGVYQCSVDTSIRVVKDDGLYDCKLRLDSVNARLCNTELTRSKVLTIPQLTARYPITPSSDGSYTMKTWLHGSPDWAFPLYLFSKTRASVCYAHESRGQMQCTCHLKGTNEDRGKKDIVCASRHTLRVTKQMTELSSYTCSMQLPPTSACFVDLIEEPRKSRRVLPLFPKRPVSPTREYEPMDIESCIFLLKIAHEDEAETKAGKGWEHPHSAKEHETMFEAIHRRSIDDKKSSGSDDFTRMEGDFFPLDEIATHPSSPKFDDVTL